jgi:hypothetical protein
MALSRLKRRWPQARFWIIDRDPAPLLLDAPQGETRLLGEAVAFFYRFGEAFHDRDWIIPAVPVHLAFDWLVGELSKEKKTRFLQPPRCLGEDLPCSQSVRKGLYLSQASFQCPDNCPSPLSHCFVTKEKRTLPLWKLLSKRELERGKMAVIESRQLAPGVGGYTFQALKKLKQQVSQASPPFFIGTACRCHGVVHGLTW